jgi:hypothetical protein
MQKSVVDFRTVDGSATSPEDYGSLSGSVTIPAGSTQATVTIQLTPDDLIEQAESFFFQLEDPVNAELADRTATVTILDDDTFPQLESKAAEASEADGILPFVVTLSHTWPQTVTVDYATRNGSAIAPADYLSDTGVLAFPPGDLTATVWVSLAEDQVDEPDENLYLVLTNPSQASLGLTQVVGIIHDSSSNTLFLPKLRR